jgi:predicted metal-binding membrane protein
VLIGAGLFQFTLLKRACLTHCRNPLSFLLARWNNGPIGGYRLGLSHGWFCVGCCWALMATTLVVGMSNLWWMLAVTAAVFVEQVVPRGHLLRVPLGVALVGAGLLAL